MTDNQTVTTPLFSNKTYDKLKQLALVVLPALGALYFALSQIWGLPYGVEVVGTITVIDTFLGALLKLSDGSWNNSEEKYDGSLEVATDDDGFKTVTLSVNEDPYEIDKKKEVVFKVNGEGLGQNI